jgi:sec-independent protein translocase protein TatA
MGSGIFSPVHIIIILVLAVLMFGSTRLPGAARSIGRSMRIFKAETKGLMHDGKDDDDEPQAAPQAQPAAPPALTQGAASPEQAALRERAAQLREQAAMHERAAELREQAARLEQQAASADTRQTY